MLGTEIVVQCSKYHIMPHQATIAQCYPAMVLEMTSGIHKHIPAYTDILSEIGIKRRKHAERIVYGMSRELGE